MVSVRSDIEITVLKVFRRGLLMALLLYVQGRNWVYPALTIRKYQAVVESKLHRSLYFTLLKNVGGWPIGAFGSVKSA